MSPTRFIILGAGPAGLTAAQTLRQHAPGAQVVMVAPEPVPPYSPPALVDHFTHGNSEALYWHGRDVCERLGLEVHHTEAAAVLPERHEVELVSREGSLRYDRLIIATGARLHAPVEGATRQGVYNFKSLTAAQALVERVQSIPDARAVIVGAGFIGVEIALLLNRLGARVSLLEMLDHPMPRILGPECGKVALHALRSQGVEVRLGVKALAFTGLQRAQAVRLESGEEIEADVFVAATGTKPNVELLKGSGIEVNDGVRVDEQMRTSAPDVFAAGDVAETCERTTRLPGVFPIFPNAVEQAVVAARNALGYAEDYEGALRMNSLKHLGVPLVCSGQLQGEREARFQAPGVVRQVFLRDRRIVGYQLAGDIRSAGVYQSLMVGKADVSAFEERLASPTFGVGRLVHAARDLA